MFEHELVPESIRCAKKVDFVAERIQLRTTTLQLGLPRADGLREQGRFALSILVNRSGCSASSQPFGRASRGLDSGTSTRFLIYDEGEAAI